MTSMKTSRPPIYPSTFVIVSFAIWIAVCLRWVNVIIKHSSPNLWLISAMLAIYGILLVLFPFLMKGSPFKAYLYFGVQSALGIGAILLSYEQDFFSMLYPPLAGQVLLLLGDVDVGLRRREHGGGLRVVVLVDDLSGRVRDDANVPLPVRLPSQHLPRSDAVCVSRRLAER